MTKQEKIARGLLSKVKFMRHWSNKPDNPFSAEDDVSDILSYLHSKGVVIRNKIDIPSEGLWMPGNWFILKVVCDALMAVAIVPLIETCPKCDKPLCKCPSINRGSFAKYVEKDGKA